MGVTSPNIGSALAAPYKCMKHALTLSLGLPDPLHAEPLQTGVGGYKTQIFG
jgi:hypothetical protein